MEGSRASIVIKNLGIGVLALVALGLALSNARQSTRLEIRLRAIEEMRSLQVVRSSTTLPDGAWAPEKMGVSSPPPASISREGREESRKPGTEGALAALIQGIVQRELERQRVEDRKHLSEAFDPATILEAQLPLNPAQKEALARLVRSHRSELEEFDPDSSRDAFRPRNQMGEQVDQRYELALKQLLDEEQLRKYEDLKKAGPVWPNLRIGVPQTVIFYQGSKPNK